MYGTEQVAEPFVLSFKEGIVLLEPPDGRILLQSPLAQIALKKSTPGLLAAMRILMSSGATEAQLIDLVMQHDGRGGLAELLYHLQRFLQRGMICHTVVWNDNKLATLVPVAPTYGGTPPEPVANTRYVLSRFAYLHKAGTRFVLETPLAPANIVLHNWRAIALLHAFVTPQRLEELYDVWPDVPYAVMLVRLFLGGQALSNVSHAKPAEAEQSTLTQWDFHDLLFHTRSRLGRHANAYGATFRFLGQIDPLAAVKPPMSLETTHLYKPDITALKDNDVPFTYVLEARQSIRQHGEPPITVEQLGEFLYRSARVRGLSGAAQGGYESSNRPYPSGGACYDLELYVAVNVCTGLLSGLYHYCPLAHQLHRISGGTRAVEALLEGAAAAAGQPAMPQILIVLAARFQRVAWKYEAMAYALSLKHVGVLYQTMYLVATAMGLAACALGGGNADVFSSAAGTDYYAETSVGEFMLGSRAADAL